MGKCCDIIPPLQVWETSRPQLGTNGGIAQLARATGSYPVGRGFKSNFRYQKSDLFVWLWPDGQAVKTPPFHGSNGGSIPPRVILKRTGLLRAVSSFFLSLSGFVCHFAVYSLTDIYDQVIGIRRA